MMTHAWTENAAGVLRCPCALNCKFVYIAPMFRDPLSLHAGLPGRVGLAVSLAGLLAACAHAPGPQSGGLTQARQEATSWRADDKSKWREVKFPGKSATHYAPVWVSGQNWLRAESRRSASMLSQSLQVNVQQHPKLRFEWWVEQGLSQADVAVRDREDSPARVILAFEGDRSEFNARDAALSELSQLMTGQPMPYATLMYVWCPQRPVGTIIHNPRTDRIRKMVVATPQTTGPMVIERDMVADYEAAFGKAPGRLVGIAIMTDSDNTQGMARTLYGPISIH